MQCRRCGKELGNSLKCKFCGYENTVGNVRELTRTEKHFFDGETIDIGSTDGQREENHGRGYEFKTRRTYINFDSNTGGGIFSRAASWVLREFLSGNKIVRVAVTLIVVALVALTVFVALPIIFVLLAAGIILLTLFNKFR